MHHLMIVGLTLLAGIIATFLFRRLKLPTVIGHLVVGILMGLSGAHIFSVDNIDKFDVFSQLALGIIGFIIGGELRWARIRSFGISILVITLCESLFSTVLVTIAVFLISQNLPLSLIVGALAAATAPGGTTQIIQEHRARGPLTSTLFGVVGADDAFAIMIYAFAFNLAKSLLSATHELQAHLVIYEALVEISGALFLGATFGIVFILIMRYFQDQDSKQLLTLSAVLICSGLALTLHTSLILSTMAMGITISNLRPHKSRPYFNSIITITPAIYILFFVLVGAKLQIHVIAKIGAIGLAYLVFRTIGKFGGAWFGSSISNAPTTVRKYLGLCLLSQAGVAIGLAMSAQAELKDISPIGQELGILVINIITASTLVFQIIGPFAAKYALEKAGEIRTRL